MWKPSYRSDEIINNSMLRFDNLVEKTLKKFKKGDKITNSNPDCDHYKSKGIVTDVKNIKGKDGNTVGKKVCYKCTNKGSTWKQNDSLEKTTDQLTKI